MNKLIIAGLLQVALLAGCATTSPKGATAEQIAQCRAMVENMGTSGPHDHNQMKGQGPNSMTLTHERCRQILAEQ